MEEIDKKFFNCLKRYLDQQNISKEIKIKLNNLVDQNDSYIRIISSLRKEVENTSYISNLNKIRGNDIFINKCVNDNHSIFNFGFNFSDDGKAKKHLIEKEIFNIKLKLTILEHEIVKTNESLIRNVYQLIIYFNNLVQIN